MNKKVLCGLLSAAVLMGACPTTALALESSLNLPKMTKGIDLRRQGDNISGTGWEWDADGLMLTLNGFQVTVPIFEMEDDPVFSLPDGSTVVVEGDDNIIETLSYQAHAFYCEGELTICSNGELEIITGTYGTNAIYCKRGPLTIEDKVEITVDPEGHVIFIEKAKGRRAVISIQDKAKVTFPEEDMDDRTILVTHSATVSPADNWLDFSTEYDEFDETVTMIPKAEEKEPVEETPAVPEEPAKDVYQITVGSPAIVKNGEVSYTADVSPYLKNGYTMLPLRALLEVSDPDLKINWNNGTKSAHAFVNNKLVTITPGENTYTKITEKIELSTPAETKDGRLFVSLRDWMNIMEIDGSQLEWNAATKTVTLKY